jgi:hypothetical protein
VLCTYQPEIGPFRVQLRSVLDQRDVDLTVDVFDDGSEAGRRSELEAACDDPRVQLRTGERLGVFHNFERGLRQVPDGVDVVLLSDQDDEWYPGKAATLAAALADRPEAQLAHSDARVVDHTGRVLAESMFAAEGRDVQRLDIDHLILKNVVTGCTAALRPRLLEHALPFPSLGPGAPFHHDLWLALCAAATGGIVTVYEPLLDYRQHARNVVGLEAATNRWRDPRRAVADWRSRRLVALTVDNAVRTGQLEATGPARVARRWLGRRGSWHLLRLARDWQRQDDPQAGFALLLGLVGTVAQLRPDTATIKARSSRARRLSSLAVRGGLRLARDAELRARVAGKLAEQVDRVPDPADVAEPLPSAVRPLPAVLSGASGRTVQVLVPFIPRTGVFGGVATALRLAVELAHQGERVRVVETDRSDRLEPAELRAAIRRSLEVPGDWLDGLSFFSAVHPQTPLPVGRDDVFMATAWWTAHRAHWTQDRLGLGDSPFVYLVQDYEPSFYPGSDVQALAEWSYRMPCWPVVNCRTLADHLRLATSLPVDDDMVLAPQVDIRALAALPRTATESGPLRVLLYGRPSVPRNLFETALRGLAAWLRTRESRRPVEVISAGEQHDDVPLGDGAVVRSVGQLPWDRYTEELSQSHVGLSLMLSPHPSYPPLEMAAAGLVVVTNRYANKDLTPLSPRIVSCDATSLDVAAGLRAAEQRVRDVGDAGRHLDLGSLGHDIEGVAKALRERLESYSRSTA